MLGEPPPFPWDYPAWPYGSVLMVPSTPHSCPSSSLSLWNLLVLSFGFLDCLCRAPDSSLAVSIVFSCLKSFTGVPRTFLGLLHGLRDPAGPTSPHLCSRSPTPPSPPALVLHVTKVCVSNYSSPICALVHAVPSLKIDFRPNESFKLDPSYFFSLDSLSSSGQLPTPLLCALSGPSSPPSFNIDF